MMHFLYRNKQWSNSGTTTTSHKSILSTAFDIRQRSVRGLRGEGRPRVPGQPLHGPRGRRKDDPLQEPRLPPLPRPLGQDGGRQGLPVPRRARLYLRVARVTQQPQQFAKFIQSWHQYQTALYTYATTAIGQFHRGALGSFKGKNCPRLFLRNFDDLLPTLTHTSRSDDD